MKIFACKSYRDPEKLALCVVIASQQGCVVPVETREHSGTENKLIQSARVLISSHYNSLLSMPASVYSAAKQLNVLQSHGQHGRVTLNGVAKLTGLFSRGQKLPP